MRNILFLTVAASVTLVACNKASDTRADDGLKNDLALAAQVQPYQAQQFVSPNEQNMALASGNRAYSARPVAAAPVRAPVRRSATRSATRSRSSGAESVYYPSAPQEPERHTGRDAAIGAAAGAVIGATTSRDKVKGGIIGAAAGGILGGIIGHTVDVKRP